MIPLWAQVILVALVFAGAAAAALHALLSKPDPRAALGWVAVCLAYPVLGPLGYLLFGVNRIRTRVRRIGMQLPSAESHVGLAPRELHVAPIFRDAVAEIVRVSERVTRRPLLAGNLVEPLYCGDQAYPAMLAEIEAASSAVWLCTYIFDTDAVGRELIDALGRATERGVDVRVLLDGVGELYSWPRARKLLAARRVRVARFLPPGLRGIHVNLRNHRKLLVIDRHVGFTGGMNIGGRHVLERTPVNRVARDVHFRIEGPVVSQLELAFHEDWAFAAGDESPLATPPVLTHSGSSFARGISDGPNEDYEQLMWILLGAVHAARQSIRIMTPYFLPDRELESALASAAMRGISVDILLPEHNNLPFVHWACMAMLPPLVRRGVRVYLQPGAFDHSKILLVDEHYSMVGSANLDPRSLRLNFEYQLEIYGEEPTRALLAHFESCRAVAHQLSSEELESRSLLQRVRDHACRLFQPYL